MAKFALLVIDVQQALIDFGPYQQDQLVESIQSLLETARQNQVPVIYVRHNEPGSEFEPGADGWQIYHEVAPIENEPIVDKFYNSAFHKTQLHNLLQSMSITDLVLVGMQVEYCVDASIKSAFDLGYRVHLPEGCQSTFDNHLFSASDLIEFYTNDIWHGRFGNTLSLDDAKMLLKA